MGVRKLFNVVLCDANYAGADDLELAESQRYDRGRQRFDDQRPRRLRLWSRERYVQRLDENQLQRRHSQRRNVDSSLGKRKLFELVQCIDDYAWLREFGTKRLDDFAEARAHRGLFGRRLRFEQRELDDGRDRPELGRSLAVSGKRDFGRGYQDDGLYRSFPSGLDRSAVFLR